MKAKTTKKTPKTGEIKVTNRELLGRMINLSNNSIITNRTANMLTQKLDKVDIKQLINWFWLADSHMKTKAQTRRRFF